jgi:hypothetical protein
MVFPSARRDVHVNAGDGAVRGFSGWNFVDYRNAPDVRPEVSCRTSDSRCIGYDQSTSA